MTNKTENTDDFFDIMQLFEAEVVSHSTKKPHKIEIKPDISRIKNALATPKAMDSLFKTRISAEFRIPGIDEYIQLYAIKKLINETPGDKVYNSYHHYKERILSRVNLAVLMHTEHIFLSNRLRPRLKNLVMAYLFWQSLSENKKREACCSILINDNKDAPSFIDLRFFYSKDKSSASSTEDWEDDDYDDYDEYGRASFDEGCLLGQYERLPGYAKDQLTVEEVAMVCAEHIAQRDLNLEMTDRQAVNDMRELILNKIKAKTQRNQNRVKAIVDGITITTLLHRARSGLGKGYPKPTPNNPTRLSVAQFPLFILDQVLNGLLTTRKRNQLLKRPEHEQRAYFKYHLNSLVIHSAIQNIDHSHVKKLGFKLPFIMNMSSLIAEIRSKVRAERDLNDTDFSILNTVAMPALKRFKKMSELDREMFFALEKKRFHYTLDIQRQLYQYSSNIPSELMEQIRTTRFFADFYMLANDAGVRVAKLRKLVKMVYQQYLPPYDSTHMKNSLSNIGHDILTNYEIHFMTFLKGWNSSPRFAAIMNKIIDLLISQLGGAQGNHHSAFAFWGQLPTLVGKELLLLDGKPKNMADVFHLTKTDITYIRKATPLLKSLPPSIVTHDELNRYASNSVGNEAFYHYLRQLSNVREHWLDKLTPITPAIHEAKKSMLGDLCIDILPYDDLLGSLGVAAQGVCIGFNDHNHLQHQNPAVANLVIRDNERIWLWGLLIRAQNTPKPTYLLNNLQGAFPSRYAKHKDHIRHSIREILSSIGDVYSLDFFFNALQLLSDDEKISSSEGLAIVPRMRLDVHGEPVTDDALTHPQRDAFMQIDLSNMYKITQP